MKYHSPQIYKQVVAMHHAGNNVNTISTTLNIPKGTLYHWVHGSRGHTKEQYYQAILLAQQGWTTTDIAKEFGVSRDTCYRWINGYFKPKSISEKWQSIDRHQPKFRLRKQLKLGYEELTSSKAYILGVLSGDAYLGKRGVWLDTKDGDFTLAFAKAILDVYGVVSKIWSEKRIIIERNQHIYFANQKARLLACSTWLVEDLASYSDCNFYTKYWCVPDQIFNATPIIQRKYLQGFIDSEGSFSWRAGSHSGIISIASSNKLALEQINTLLHTNGIDGHFIDKERMYAISITGCKNLYEFVRTIGFTIQRKQSKLLNYLSLMCKEEENNYAL